MFSSPRLSFFMIARNEAANITRCLDSVKAVCDEIVVIDTGSTDNTAALAQSRGAAVYDFPWRDDFSAAYNEGLDKVTGDWVFCLDADEWLLPEGHLLMRNLIEQPDVLAYYIQRQEMECDDQEQGFVEMRQLRLCRNVPSLRCVGYDHPQVAAQVEEYGRQQGLKVLDSPLRVRHCGYLPSRKHEKLKRAELLLQKELTERPGQMYYEIELARTWEQMGDPRGGRLSKDLLARILARSTSRTPPSVLAMTILEKFLRSEPGDTDQLRLALRTALKWFPNSPPILDAAASLYFRNAQFARAIPLLERLVDAAENGRYDRVIAFSSEVLGDGIYLNLAVCHHRLAHLDKAEHWYRQYLDRQPSDSDAVQNLHILLEQRRQYA